MRQIYDHLASYGLDKEGEISRRLAKFSEAMISGFLQSYLEIATNTPLAVAAPGGATDIYPDSLATAMPIDIIRQLAIYANRIYVHDPMIELALEWGHVDHPPLDIAVKYSSRPERIAFYRRRLASAIERLLQLRPLPMADIIHLAPTELVHPRQDPTTLYAQDIYGPEGPFAELMGLDGPPQLPATVLAYSDEHLRISPAKFVDDDLQLVESAPESTEYNQIAIRFAGDPLFHCFAFAQFNVVPDPSESGSMRWTTSFDIEGRDRIDPRTFDHWVKNSKRQCIMDRMGRLQTDLTLSTSAGARFLTNLPASRDLALLDLGAKVEGKRTNVITGLLRLDLPFFESVTLSDIAEARRNEAAFEDFRVAMDKAFNEIHALTDSEQFQTQIDEISRDLLRRPLDKIDKRMGSLKRNVFLDATIMLIGSLASNFVFQGNNLVAAAAATALALRVLKQAKNADEEIQQMPSFFYWDVTRKAR